MGGRALGVVDATCVWAHVPTRSNKCMTEQWNPDQDDLGLGLQRNIAEQHHYQQHHYQSNHGNNTSSTITIRANTATSLAAASLPEQTQAISLPAASAISLPAASLSEQTLSITSHAAFSFFPTDAIPSIHYSSMAEAS